MKTTQNGGTRFSYPTSLKASYTMEQHKNIKSRNPTPGHRILRIGHPPKLSLVNFDVQNKNREKAHSRRFRHSSAIDHKAQYSAKSDLHSDYPSNGMHRPTNKNTPQETIGRTVKATQQSTNPLQTYKPSQRSNTKPTHTKKYKPELTAITGTVSDKQGRP